MMEEPLPVFTAAKNNLMERLGRGGGAVALKGLTLRGGLGIAVGAEPSSGSQGVAGNKGSQVFRLCLRVGS